MKIEYRTIYKRITPHCELSNINSKKSLLMYQSSQKIITVDINIVLILAIVEHSIKY